jgi:hypothetical protein
MMPRTGTRILVLPVSAIAFQTLQHLLSLSQPMNHLLDLEISKDLQRRISAQHLRFSAAFISCLRGKISLCEMLILNYPLLCKGDLRLGSRARGSICAHYPNLPACRRRAETSVSLPWQGGSLQMLQTLGSNYNKGYVCQSCLAPPG